MIRSFADSGVLIAAARGNTPHTEAALRLLTSRSVDRIMLTSPFVWLETFPKAAYMRMTKEIEFYEGFFADPAVIWCRDWEQLDAIARRESVKSGLSAVDALNVAAAHLLHAEELVTTEKPGKALYRTDLVKVVALL